MNNLSDNIITINGTQENLFDKAIFVMKSEKQEDASTIDFAREADKILNNYMLQAVLDIQKTKTPNEKIITKTITQNRKRTKQDAFIDRMLGFSILFCLLVVTLIILT